MQLCDQNRTSIFLQHDFSMSERPWQRMYQNQGSKRSWSADRFSRWQASKSKEFYVTDATHKLFWKFASFSDDFAVSSGFLGFAFRVNVRCFCITYASDHDSKMMCFIIGDKNAAEGKIKYYIFSSDKGEWRGSEARLLNSNRMSDLIVDITGQSRCRLNLNGVLCGRELYWLFPCLMLVYQSDEVCFRAVDLTRQNVPGRGLIWQSEGILHYWNLNSSGFYVWTYKPDKDSEEKWKLKEKVEMEKLDRRTREVTGLEQRFIYRPMEFSDELQVVYLEAGASFQFFSPLLFFRNWSHQGLGPTTAHFAEVLFLDIFGLGRILSKIKTMQVEFETKNEKGESSTERRIIYLGEEILDEILQGIPLKPLTRFKCVSKAWCREIEAVRASKWHPKSSCLVLNWILGMGNFLQGNCKTILLTPQDHGEECIKIKAVEVPGLLISSRNGWHLYRERGRQGSTKSYLTETLHEKFWQFLTFPIDLTPLSVNELKVRCYCIVHASGHGIKLFCFTIENQDIAKARVNYYLLSSDKMEWRNYEAILMKSSSFCNIRSAMHQCHTNTDVSGVLCLGKIYWLLQSILLVYHFDENCFRFVELPGEKWHVHGLIWQCEGILFYCNLDNSGLHIWTYRDHGSSDCTFSYWKLKETVEIEKLKRRIHEITVAGLEFVWPSPYLRPKMFSDEFQVLYLESLLNSEGQYDLCRSFLFAYSLETRELSKAWTYSSPMSRGFISH